MPHAIYLGGLTLGTGNSQGEKQHRNRPHFYLQPLAAEWADKNTKIKNWR